MADTIEKLSEFARLLEDPPWQIRRDRRIGEGPLPEAEKARDLLDFLCVHRDCARHVVFEVWDKTTAYG